MSKNAKNIVRNAYMSNFTKKKKHRYILTEKSSELDIYVKDNLNTINDGINVAIQELSIRVTKRQLPYITIERLPINIDSIKISPEDTKRRVRGIFRDFSTETDSLKVVSKYINDSENISHSIEFFANTVYNELTFSNIHFDAKILVNKEGLRSVFTDIFLDSAMFNSFSFLKEMDTVAKHKFGEKKLEFFRKKNLPCFYRIDSEDEEKLLYYSLAFSCRKSDKDFDYDMYMTLWDDFIDEYYPNERHREKSVKDQLKQYVDPQQLPQDISKKIMRKQEGAYLLLRINKNQTPSLNRRVMNYFGLKEYHLGEIKIVDVSEYYNIQDMLVHLDVAAFKIVRPPINRRKTDC